MIHIKSLGYFLVLLSGVYSNLYASEEETLIVTDQNGVAIGGYDPVAYFVEGEALAGDAAFQTSYLGATWYFSSEKNRQLFEADPERYMIEFGGYCPVALSKGKAVQGTGTYWYKMEDPDGDKVFLNLDFFTQVNFNWNTDKIVKAAYEKWPEVRKQELAKKKAGL